MTTVPTVTAVGQWKTEAYVVAAFCRPKSEVLKHIFFKCSLLVIKSYFCNIHYNNIF